MRFKVGNKVKFVKKLENHSDKVRLGGIYKIKYVDSFTSYMPYKTENGEWFGEKELELANYTYEDLKKSPIGTKITFENGEVFVKNGKDKFESPSTYAYIDSLKNLEHYTLGKIIKIEEPEYKTVYEAKEVLDEAEKRYLKGVIRPFRSKVLQIAKKYDCFTELEYIKITIKDDASLEFPSFSKNTMYKNMEIDKKYTLEELGL